MNLPEAVKNAGVVGAGGAGFPTHVKLSTTVESFIVNAAECEPLMEIDKYLCRNFAEEIVAAASIVSAHLGAKRTVIALKAKYVPEIAALDQAIKGQGAAMEIFGMDAFYPAGDEQIMVQQVLGKIVPERGIPKDIGVVVENAGTLLNIFDAMKGKPVKDKFLSVVGEVREPIMLHVPVGTSIKECIEKAGPTVDEYAVIIGGPMMGMVLENSAGFGAEVVTKTTGNIVVLPGKHYLAERSHIDMKRLATQAKSVCIQCRFCTDMCPRHLLGHQIRPHLVMRNFFKENFITDDAEYLRAFGDAVNCCECNVCELYACPMGLSPRRINIHFKGKLREKGIQPERNLQPTVRQELSFRRIPTYRLAARLGLERYYGRHAHECYELVPDTVYIPFKQHIGKPAVPVKKQGDRVKSGELLAAADNGLSANIHASIDGIVTALDKNGAHIAKEA